MYSAKTGTVRIQETQNPIEGVRVELWDVNDAHGLIYSTESGVGGVFTVQITDALETEFNGSNTPLFKVYSGDTLLTTIEDTSKALVLTEDDLYLDIPIATYDASIKNNIPYEEKKGYALVEGVVYGANGGVLPNVSINIYEKKFRDKVLITTTQTDANGQFRSRISIKDIVNAKTISARQLRIEAVNSSSDVIAVASDLPLTQDVISVTLNAGGIKDQLPSAYNDATVSTFSGITSKINYITDTIDIATVGEGVTDEHSDEVDYIAKSIGVDYAVVRDIVSAHKMANDIDAVQTGGATPVDRNFMYAITRETSASINPALKYKGSEIKAIIKSAEKDKLIDAYLEYELTTVDGEQVAQATAASEASFDVAIDDFVAAIKTYQVEETKNITVEQEDYTLNDVMTAIFSADSSSAVQAEIDTFLTAYNDETYGDPETFWEAYPYVDTNEVLTNATIAEKAKAGLKLAGVAGMQKEVIAGVMSDLYTTYSSFDIKKLATWDESTWVTKVTAICEAADGGAGKLCVPKSIRGEETSHTSAEGTAAIASYAKTMKNMIQEAYPQTAIAYKVENNTALSSAMTNSTQAVTFLNNNPDLDLRVTNIRDVDFSSPDYDNTGVTDETALRSDLEPYQRLLRMVGGKPDAIETMRIDGMHSASSITSISQDSFISTYSTALGGDCAAKTVYATAEAIKAVITMNAVSFSSGDAPTYVYPPNRPIQIADPSAPDPVAHPDLVTLFGNQNYCTCGHCSSLYSPSAYFVDVLNFLKKHNASAASGVYDELIRRRSDLTHIDLTCQNANTAMPYIDLVNEVLETRILKDVSGVTAPLSFQTQGDTEELKAHPEHVVKNDTTGEYEDYTDYKSVYDGASPLKDANAVYPYQLPFNLAQEESRTYLEHIGKTRYELMQLFKPVNTSPSNDIDDYALVSEWLGLTTGTSDTAADIITGQHSNSANTWLFYGLSGATGVKVLDPQNSGKETGLDNWDSLLTGRIDVLIQQARIAHKDLLELLSTDFLNPNAEITIVTQSASISEDTCDLSKLKLNFTGSATAAGFLGKLHRFIRLMQATKKSIYELDTLMRILSISTLTKAEFINLVQVLQLSASMNIQPEVLACSWANIDTKVYTKYDSGKPKEQPSVYQKVFLDKLAINTPVTDLIQNFEDPSNITGTYASYQALIAASAKVQEEEVALILEHMGLTISANISLLGLSRIIAVGAISRSLKQDVAILLSWFNIVGIDTAVIAANGNDSQIIAGLEALYTLYDKVMRSAFSANDLRYISEHVDEGQSYIATNEDIQLFYEGLRAQLQKFDEDQNTAKLENVVVQYFATAFALPAESMAKLLADLTVTNVGSTGFIDNLISAEFITSDEQLTEGLSLANLILSEFYAHYQYLTKVAFVCNRLAIEPELIVWLYDHPTAFGLDFTALPKNDNVTQTVIDDTVSAVLNISMWLHVKKKLGINATVFIELLESIITPSASDFEAIIAAHTKLGAQWKELVDVTTSTANGILYILFGTDLLPSNEQSATTMMNIINIMSWCKVSGLSPMTTQSVLSGAVDLEGSNKILLAAKSKHEDQAWLSIAKPIRDAIRRKQRDALVAYLLANPDATADEYWRNKNELFEHFLIDTEMEPCMLTSRIKQAVASIQIYINRVLLGVEYTNNNYGDPNSKLTMTGDLPTEWAKWRKWYRIWEANRKVFLYPENWIEPELRDDKTSFFDALETELQQDDLTNALAEDALANYLEKMDEVARLEPVGCCEDDDGNVHVIARTYGHPNKYFYRRLEGDVWTAWESVEMDIKSDHVTPVFWNRRLYLFWLSFRETQEKFYLPAGTKMTDFNQGDSYGSSYWFFNDDFDVDATTGVDSGRYQKILYTTVNWTEYKNNKWQKPKVAKEELVTKINPKVEDYILSQINDYERGPKAYVTGKNSVNFRPGATQKPLMGVNYNGAFLKLITEDKDISALDLIKSRMYLFPYIYNPTTDNKLDLWLMYPTNFWLAQDCFLHTAAYEFTDSSLEPIPQKREHSQWTFTAPFTTFVKNMKYVEHTLQFPDWPSGNKLYLDRLRDTQFDLRANGSSQRYQYLLGGSWNNSLVRAYDSSARSVILDSISNGNYKLVGKSNFGDKPLENQFFFEDNKHTYFVRRVVPEYAIVGSATNLGNVFNSGIPVGSTTTALAGIGTANTLLTATSNTSFQSAFAVSGTYYPTTTVSVGTVGTQATAGPTAIGTAPVTGTTPTLNGLSISEKYYFQTFYHSHIHEFKKALNRDGIDGLMQLELQKTTDSMNFGSSYNPNSSLVVNQGSYLYPTNELDFDYRGTYSIYNWELFFHTPMLIAQRLSDNQKFEEAQKWYHYIFNPTANTDEDGAASKKVSRFWRFKPFYDQANEPVETLNDILENISKGNTNAGAQITQWEDDPFKPHAIARMRVLAYMKNVVMKYVDNLIAWADQLFRRDTIESLNEATNLYILAANILGRKPEEIASRVTRDSHTFSELITAGSLDGLSNGLVALESYVGPNAINPSKLLCNGKKSAASKLDVNIAYFCAPSNPQLLEYWDRVADRLFKIRNCMNIDGQTRSLPLYEPPIDPALLVKAAAAGIDIDSLMNDFNSNEGKIYRFNYIVQKANEFCGDVKALGGALLSALEKKDAEHLAALRASQEVALLDKVRLVKETQLKEAEANLEALQKSKEITQSRYDYYNSRSYMNDKEKAAAQMMAVSHILEGNAGTINSIGSGLAAIPQLHMQGVSTGPSFGGIHLASLFQAVSATISVGAGVMRNKSGTLSTLAGYDRRRDDWQFQARTAQQELEQIDKQIIASEIRIAMSQKELDSHDTQVAHATEVNDYMRSKFTNKQLYTWMVSQLSATYFQAYQLAYDMAKKAESCFDYELPYAKKPATGFIQFGYWDSLKKGLLSGEKLQLDIRKLEAAYIDSNKRELELTKHVSLALTDPEALIELKENGSCFINLKEELFDLDYPGHYYRRLKSVSISIPCVAGPYTTINATLELHNTSIRKGDSGIIDASLTTTSASSPKPSIATSGGQNDSGLFELNFNDARYLPFEGKGAISEWRLELADTNQIRLFDFDTISDVILHVKYTAKSDDSYKATRIAAINTMLSSADSGLSRYFSLKHEYVNEWNKYGDNSSLDISLSPNQFPFFTQGKSILTEEVYFLLKLKTGVSGQFKIVDSSNSIDITLIGSTTPAYTGSKDYEETPVAISSMSIQLQKYNESTEVWDDVTDIESILQDIYMVTYYGFA